MTLTVVGCRVDWREIFAVVTGLCKQASCHSRAFKVLDPRVDDIDLERLCAVAPVMMIRMYLPRWMLMVGIVLIILVELLSAPD